MTDAEATIVPANEASRDDIQIVFSTRGEPTRCQCQRYRTHPGELRRVVMRIDFR
jgi:hypothetical protein